MHVASLIFIIIFNKKKCFLGKNALSAKWLVFLRSCIQTKATYNEQTNDYNYS